MISSVAMARRGPMPDAHHAEIERACVSLRMLHVITVELAGWTVQERAMKKLLAFALLGLALCGGATQSSAAGCCIETPKQCFPVLRIPPEDYVYSPAVFFPPDKPVPYSVWRYSLYEPFCSGQPAAKCIWACAKAPPKRDAALRVGG